MSTVREEKKKTTKKAILQAAIRLFGKNGYKNTTIEQLAKEAGIGKGTVYGYFNTKSEILYAFCEDEMEYIHQQLAGKSNQDDPILEQVLTFFMAEFHYITKNPGFGRLFMQEMIFPKPNFQQGQQDKAVQNYLAMIIPIITRAQERGELRAELDPLDICGHFYALYLILVHSCYAKMTPYDQAETTLRRLFTQVIEGLQTHQTSRSKV
ncbi:MAG: TetR/AcrR family transcriptional regulator [Desulfocapsa sp.]|nr:TetR/AcrR family transcriptional regulator [Desulfocapsa sp.]